MKVRYTDLCERQRFTIPAENFDMNFERGKWYEVPDKIGVLLMRNPHFMSENDLIFNKKLLAKPGIVLAFKRFGALGDIVQLMPTARKLKQLYKKMKIILVTEKMYVDAFKGQPDVFDQVVDVTEFQKINFDKMVFLDGIAERDHSLTNEERLIHRARIFAAFFQLEIENYDFSFKVSEKDRKYVEDFLNALDK